ncbi:MAG TPA: hypothetical protein VNT81_18055 [Vicinamibacterales bacterium]|nr:hypothetical protein [Vicinamibacterales bacterium]
MARGNWPHIRHHRGRLGAAAALLATVLAACSGSPTAPSAVAELTERVSTAHFDFAWSRGDSVDTVWQEAFHEWATRELDVTITRRISYSKYLSPGHMLELHYGPGNVNAWADPNLFTLHTIWAFDNHEVIHLYASTFGQATSVLNEGLAVAYQVDPVRNDMTPRWNNRHVHDVAASLRRQGRLVPLGEMLTIDQFRALDSQIAYPVAGSFVRFLLDHHGGVAPIKRLFGLSAQRDAPETTRSNIASVYEKPLEALEQDWLALLDRR